MQSKNNQRDSHFSGWLKLPQKDPEATKAAILYIHTYPGVPYVPSPTRELASEGICRSLSENASGISELE